MSATQIVGITSDPDDEDGIAVYGDAEADFQMSFQNSMRWKDLELSFVLHWKQGGDAINLTSLLSDIFQTSFDYDGTDLDPDGVLSNGDYRLSQLGVSAEPWVQDASYVRLRELGLFYNIPRAKLKNVFKNSVQSIRVGVSGYNLLSFFSYNSYDPEVSNFVGRGVSSGVEVSPFPSSKRFYFHFDIGF